MERIALGCDYFINDDVYARAQRPGFRWLAGAEEISQLPNVTGALVAAGYREQEIRGILGGNALRLLEQVWRGLPHSHRRDGARAQSGTEERPGRLTESCQESYNRSNPTNLLLVAAFRFDGEGAAMGQRNVSFGVGKRERMADKWLRCDSLWGTLNAFIDDDYGLGLLLHGHQ